MNILQKTIKTADKLQRKHAWIGFPYAVIKKYGDDEAGYQAALLTYYGFLSLFPLLLVLTTLVTVIPGHNMSLQQTIIDSTTTYFPMLGNQLSGHVHSIHKTGLALAVGILFTLYGARGVADAFRHGVSHIWGVPRPQRVGFPKSIYKSFSLIVIGGAGFMLASLITAFAAGAGHGVWFRLLSLALNTFILFWLFLFLLQLSLPQHVTIKETRAGAASAAIGLVILQVVGGYVLARQLKSLDALYSTFAVTLGLLFWIYLQAQVMFYSIEITSVKAGRFWPRSMDSNDLTPADKRVYASLATQEQVVEREKVIATFE